MTQIFVSTHPFAEGNAFPIEMLKSNSIPFFINPLKRKLTEEELIKFSKGSSVLIAGTEQISRRFFSLRPELKFISRVGIGLDNIDMNVAKKSGVKISYTPDAPAPAVAELTIGLMISLLRRIHENNFLMHNGTWARMLGKRIAECTIGIVGLGRIGIRVLRRLSAFGTPRILVNDILPNLELNREFKLNWVTKEEIYKNCDLISLHLPLTKKTKNLICLKQLKIMKKDVCLVNTSRGGIINEKDLHRYLYKNSQASAAVDVFSKEPYIGPLQNLQNCLLTSHLGSMSKDCRTRMEIEATEEAIRFLKGAKLKSEVPYQEYLG